MLPCATNRGNCFTRYISIVKDSKCSTLVLRKPPGYWNKLENVQSFLNGLNVKTIREWDAITAQIIREKGGSRLLKKYSLYEIKCLGNINGKNQYFPLEYWNKKENILVFLNEIKDKLKLNTINDWNLITRKEICEFGGEKILKKYSMRELKSFAFPEGEYIFYNEPNQKQPGYWNKKENIQNFLSKLKEKLNLNTIDDWNLLNSNQIKENGGSRLLKIYSLYEIKCFGFPEGKLHFLHESNQKQPGYWDKKENIQNFLSKLKEKLNLQTIDDWNLLNSNQIKENGGDFLLNLYSLYDLKCFGCPEGKNIFKKPIKYKYWNNQENVQNFLEKLKKKLNLQSPNDWNGISIQNIKENGGIGLLNHFSLYDLKCFACPEGKEIFSYHPNKRKSSEYWENEENVQNFLCKLKEKFNLQTMDDWNRISIPQIQSIGGSGLLLKYSKDELINKQFENYSGQILKFKSNRASQRWLFLQIKKLFPGEEIIEDYFHSELSRKTGYPVQFDVFLLSRNIAFEYHGKQHYEDVPAFSQFEMRKYRDSEKEKICADFGIQLIIIPYWWDNNIESLKISINDHK